MMDAYTYNDVLIKPRYSEIETRTDVDISTQLGNIKLTLPVVSSNMKDVTGPKMASTISKYGGLGLLHRFCTIEENVSLFKEALDYYDHNSDTGLSDYGCIGVSIGVKEEDKKRFEKLYEADARIFCIDVAHGHHLHVKNMLKWINDQVFLWDRSARKELTLIAGNIATPEAYEDLIQWGADVAKVGIGPSFSCRTRYNTGVGVPQLYALQTIYDRSFAVKDPIPFIADGGISHVGSISKALKYANAVMIGNIIAGTSETPGNVYRNEAGEFYKVYGGSSSGENKGENRFVEGVIQMVKFKGHAKYILREIEQGLQSAFSYVGARNLKEFQDKCEFVKISYGSHFESKI